ncbi:MAG: DUF3592 domain-containing protein [Pirellulales bacterium]|nr:DUF3592 domain-containing protein [Pirellulales bacterium]
MDSSGNWGPFKPAAVVLLAVGAVLWLAGVFVDGTLLYWVQPAVEGKITSSKAAAVFPPGNERALGKVQVHYEYIVNGTKYTGVDEFPWTLSQDRAAKTAEVPKKFAVNENIPLCFDARKPSESGVVWVRKDQIGAVRKILGLSLQGVGGLLVLIAVVIEAVHTVIQLREGSWDV